MDRNRTGIYFAIAYFGVVALAGTLALSPQSQAVPRSRRVEVVNVPLPVTGDVRLTGIPNVSVANSPTVRIGNTAGQPVPVTGTINATLAGPLQAQQSGQWKVGVQNDQVNLPYNESQRQVLGANQFGATFNFDVPAGNRLIIETVSVACTSPPGEPILCVLTTRSDGSETQTYLSTQLQGLNAGFEVRVGTHPISARVDGTAAGNEITIFIARDPANGQAAMDASVRGYLVPLD